MKTYDFQYPWLQYIININDESQWTFKIIQVFSTNLDAFSSIAIV